MIITIVQSSVILMKIISQVNKAIIKKKILFTILYLSVLYILAIKKVNSLFLIFSIRLKNYLHFSKATLAAVRKNNIMNGDDSIQLIQQTTITIVWIIFLMSLILFSSLRRLIYLLSIDSLTIFFLLLSNYNLYFIAFLSNSLVLSIYIYIKKKLAFNLLNNRLILIAFQNFFISQSFIEKVFSTSSFLKLDRI